MAKLRKRALRSRRHWEDDHRCWVCKGMGLAGNEWRKYDNLAVCDIPADVLDDMAEAWEQFRDELMHRVESDLRYWAGKRPWGFWAFDHKRDDTMTEAEQLKAMGLLFPGELRELSSDRRSFWPVGAFERGDAGEVENDTTNNQTVQLKFGFRIPNWGS